MSSRQAAAGRLPEAVEYLLGTQAIRERCANVLAAVEAGGSAFFRIDRQCLGPCADVVAEVTREQYPDLRIPYHSRWRHFEAGGVDRSRQLALRFGAAGLDRLARVRSEIDLTVVSVLLDAGAGPDWRFEEPDGPDARGPALMRSEGLGVASWHLFVSGVLSGIAGDPLRADAAALRSVTAATIGRAFQVSASNPLVGVDGRAELLRRLGRALEENGEWFAGLGRPGGLFDRLTDGGRRPSLPAGEILAAVLRSLAGIWPSDNRLDGHALGDCWPHRLAGGDGPGAGWVPIHKLSQWMTYSLLEPFERAGVTVTALDDLTALAEYRNGGLLIDTGVIGWREAGLADARYQPSDEAIIEWRALTVALMPAVAAAVRERLGREAAELPLARILEGGTWAAGRRLAATRRGGLPPVQLVSDGTVF